MTCYLFTPRHQKKKNPIFFLYYYFFQIKILSPPRCVSVYSIKMEMEKLAQEKTEMQRHYVMVSHAFPPAIFPQHFLPNFSFPPPVFTPTHTHTHTLQIFHKTHIDIQVNNKHKNTMTGNYTTKHIHIYTRKFLILFFNSFSKTSCFPHCYSFLFCVHAFLFCSLHVHDAC